MSESETADNARRKNGAKSKGPKTPESKAISALNAMTHGLLASAPVVEGVERPEDWEAHRISVFQSLRPEGALEGFLSERVALQSWKLARLARYEQELTRDQRQPPDNDLAEADDKRTVARFIANLDEREDDEGFAPCWATTMIEGFADSIGIEYDNIPEVPADSGQGEAVSYEERFGWSAKLIRDVRAKIAKIADVSPDLLQHWAKKRLKDAARKATERIAAWKRSRILPDPDTLERLARYEAHISRQLIVSLHELERLQARRAGANVPAPVALDISLSGDGGIRSTRSP